VRACPGRLTPRPAMQTILRRRTFLTALAENRQPNAGGTFAPGSARSATGNSPLPGWDARQRSKDRNLTRRRDHSFEPVTGEPQQRHGWPVAPSRQTARSQRICARSVSPASLSQQGSCRSEPEMALGTIKSHVTRGVARRFRKHLAPPEVANDGVETMRDKTT